MALAIFPFLFCFVLFIFKEERTRKGSVRGWGRVSGREGACGRPSCVTPKKATRISRKKLKSLKAALTISI